jgi:hypothetical protein
MPEGGERVAEPAVGADDVLPTAHEGVRGGGVEEESPLPIVAAPTALSGDDGEERAARPHAADASVAEERAVVGLGCPVPWGASGGDVGRVLGDDEYAERIGKLEHLAHEVDEAEVRGAISLPAGGAGLNGAVSVKQLRGARVVAEDGNRGAGNAAEDEAELEAADSAEDLALRLRGVQAVLGFVAEQRVSAVDRELKAGKRVGEGRLVP